MSSPVSVQFGFRRSTFSLFHTGLGLRADSWRFPGAALAGLANASPTAVVSLELTLSLRVIHPGASEVPRGPKASLSFGFPS